MPGTRQKIASIAVHLRPGANTFGGLMATFLDDYWWAVFPFLIFMFTVALRPAKSRPRRRANHGSSARTAANSDGESEAGER